jgi:sulfotransferase family protein
VDIPVAPYYQQLDALYPGSRFILTVRNKAAWLRSIESHWRLFRQWCRCDRQFGRFSEFVATAVYGTMEFDAQRFSSVYDLHERSVRDYFRHRPRDLLVMDICAGDGWNQLCPFLDRKVFTEAFPCANRKEDKEYRWQWIRWLDEATLELEALVGGGMHFALLDDWQLAGSALAAKAAARFLERKNVYFGPPADDSEAIAETQRLAEAGIQFLIVAWPSFWWFDHYPRWADFLRQRSGDVFQSAQLRVFDLQPATEARRDVFRNLTADVGHGVCIQ